MSKHTPGMINLETKPTSCGAVHKLHPISTCIYEDNGRDGRESVQRANAERLRDCWNACEGIADPAKLREQRDELLSALKDMFQLMDEGILVRDTSRDHDPNWAGVAIGLVTRLKFAHDAISKATGDA